MNPLHEFFAAGEHFDIQIIQCFTRDFDPGVFVVVGTMHLGSCRCIASPDLFDGRFDQYVQLALTVIDCAQKKSHTGQGSELVSFSLLPKTNYQKSGGIVQTYQIARAGRFRSCGPVPRAENTGKNLLEKTPSW